MNVQFDFNNMYVLFFFFSLQKHCKKDKDQLWVHYKPSLFQHIGTHSSLKGKVQKLKVIFSNFNCQTHRIIPL